MSAKPKAQPTPGKWYMGVGEQYCFHRGNRVAICAKGDDPGSEQTIAEVWPTDDDTDIADGRIMCAGKEMLAVLVRVEQAVLKPGSALHKEIQRVVKLATEGK